MRVVITGASGFLGAGLAERLGREPDALGKPVTHLVLADRSRSPGLKIEGGKLAVEWRCGDLASAASVDALLADPVDCLFHLASVPGALAESSAEPGWSVNLLAPLALADRLARQGRETGIIPRIVFASSIAVYGPLGPGPVTEEQAVRPAITYGAHKLMTEILLADLSRRGEIDARSLRLPGIVARPPTESGHDSAFMSLVFHKALARQAYVCPVSRDATAWWMSRQTCLDNLIHAMKLGPDGLPGSRCWQLPALHAAIGDILGALEEKLRPECTAGFSFEPDEITMQRFGRYPALETPRALEAGFLRDQDAASLVQQVLAP